MIKPTENTPAGNFLALLQGKSHGVTLPTLDSELARLVRVVQETGRKGQLIYKLTVTPNAKRGVKVEDSLDIKEPKVESGVDFFFVGEQGSLFRNDPNQTELPLRAVPDDTDKPVKIAANH